MHTRKEKYISLDMKAFLSVRRFLWRWLWWLLAAALIFTCLFFVFPSLPYGKAEEDGTQKVVLRIFHVDTFEGGRGARGGFLSKIASRFEKENEGVICMVTTKTVEGLKLSLQEGDIPDLLSFGVGAGFAYDYCVGEPTPWYRGGYALYCKGEDFSSVNADNTVLSKGGYNLPSVAAAMEGWKGNFAEEDATTAYVQFLSGRYTYLLGTQRDACRFASRGVSVCAKPLTAFSDLYGYIGVSATEGSLQKRCQAFLELLTGESSQEALTKLGLMSPYGAIYDEREPLLQSLEKSRATYTLPLYADVAQVEECASRVLAGESIEKVKNLLKFFSNTSKK